MSTFSKASSSKKAKSKNLKNVRVNTKGSTADTNEDSPLKKNKDNSPYINS